ncbi:MAG: glycosyltransferase family 9 protein [Phycisphaerae bacterium]|nr:glycosyltransferase family 9 protein [Phycisphaerae bacterium]
MSQPASTPAAPQRVLIIKPSALGDVVTALPVLRGLKRTFPQVQIDWLLSTSCAGLLEGDADLHEIILFDRKKLGRCWKSPIALTALMKFRATLRAGRYDWVIDLQGLIRSGIFSRWTKAKLRAGFADAREGAPLFYTHRIKTTAEHTVDKNIELAVALGIDARKEGMTLHVSEAGRAFAAEFCREHQLSHGEYLICVPPTRWVTKQYPIRHWRQVVAELAGDCPIVLLGSPAENERRMCAQIAENQGPAVIDLAGQTSLPEMVALIAESAGVVCCDSAAKFIAPAVGVDCVTLIGPTRTQRTGPYLRGKAIVADVPCQGCLKKRCGHISCMDSISPAAVVQAAREMLPAGVTQCLS